jgi:hypothetical protein
VSPDLPCRAWLGLAVAFLGAAPVGEALVHFWTPDHLLHP